MSEFEDDKVKEFMIENYPEQKDNIEMGRILYQRSLGKNPKVKKLSMIRPEEKTIEEVNQSEAKTKVCFDGVVVEITTSQYKGCSVCRKSEKTKCSCSKGELVVYDIHSFLVGDNTGMVWASGFGKPEFKEGNHIQVVGVVSEYKGSKEVQVYEITILSDLSIDALRKVAPPVSSKPVVPVNADKKVKIDKVLTFIKKSGIADLDVVRNMLNMEGLVMNDIASLIYVDSDSNSVQLLN